MKYRFFVVAVLSFLALNASTGKATASRRFITSAEKELAARASADLIRAAAAGDILLLKSAIRRGAPLEIRDSQYLFTPLGWAAWKGQSKAVSVLLAAGANTEARSTGGTAMPLTLNSPFLGNTIGPEPSDQTPLALAILGNTPQTTSIVRDLLRHGAKPNALTGTGNNALFYASLISKPAVIDALLAKGANPNQRGNNYLSPLSAALVHIGGENPTLVQKLLAAGANPNDRMFNYTIADFARAIKRTRSARLIEAAQKKKLQDQIRAAAQPPILYPAANSIPILLG